MAASRLGAVGIEAAITQADGGAAPAGRPVRVRRALISVSDKTAVAEFARGLERLGIEILSTGGTAAALREAGVDVTESPISPVRRRSSMGA